MKQFSRLDSREVALKCCLRQLLAKTKARKVPAIFSMYRSIDGTGALRFNGHLQWVVENGASVITLSIGEGNMIRMVFAGKDNGPDERPHKDQKMLMKRFWELNLARERKHQFDLVRPVVTAIIRASWKVYGKPRCGTIKVFSTSAKKCNVRIEKYSERGYKT